MLRIDSRNTNYGAACMKDEQQIAYFGASVSSSRIDANISIDNIDLLTENKTIFNNDFISFITTISANEEN